MCAPQPINHFAFLVTTSNQALPLTANFGANSSISAKPDNPPCLGGVISEVLSSSDLRTFLDPNVCDQTKPATTPPLDTWCLVVSNPGTTPVYVSIKIDVSVPSTPTSTAPSGTTSTGGTTVVVTVPSAANSARQKINNTESGK
ncbi:4609_t:CDS:2 [Paraglomus brasilianum]|uniref:4609_t:CDS:1 n=1 Tax=Paraglomus brasilianum TaxID=144538 RepID=A0A9N9BDX6_9GLOM|nr:4609_t:CDS:2 [Paraglomus brasilianum]